jgi:serine/threonine protein kinase
MEVLKNGDLIKISKGSYAQVMDKLGEGGQGVVYRVWYENKEYALKWYFINKLKNPHEFYQNLMDNAKRGRPTPAFLWPLYVTEIQRGSFGYLMELRPEKYLDFGKFLTANAFFESDIAVINAGLHLANGFMKLHREGYSYQDLNDGNFFINPEDGDVLICDNDNVSTKNLGIAGKCRYMAPEVVKGKEKPNSYTDRFSLAIVLFMHFFRSHPFEGARTVENPCMTDAMEKKYFGTNPVFCFDPNNATNRPVKGVHNDIIRLWPMYPKYIQQAFTDVFTRGVNDVSERLTARQWKKTSFKTA